MSKSVGETTVPCSASTARESARPPSLALVIVWSASQPHRVGEIAFFAFGQRLYIGRGDVKFDKFAHFLRHRPGEMPAVDLREGFVSGASISRRQLRLCCVGDALEMEVVGRLPTLVNGEQCERATLRPGDTVLLKGELLLLCVERPMELASPPSERPLHAYGEADEAGIVGESAVIWELRRDVAAAAEQGEHVLILGESGAGKELTARAVHRLSNRARGPFVSRNASTFPRELIASELFGNRANYPNPGMPALKGLFGEAHGGTLFLDEIGDSLRELQPQLLRVMDEGEYQAVGESTVRRVDVRVIGATNSDESALREELFARFLLKVRVPPLRERREDIPLLIRHFLRQRAERFPPVGKRFLANGPDGRLHPKISSRFVDHLVRHPLRRNTRELHGILLRAIAMSRGDVLVLPDEGSKRPPLPPPSPELADSSAGMTAPPKEEVLACLNRERWNVARAARVLGIGRRSLYRLMELYGIEREPLE